MRRTKIVCTIGPATEDETHLRRLIHAGMDVARLNFSHGDFASHARIIRRIRQINRQIDKPLALLQDLPGPKLRVGAFEGSQVKLRAGQLFILTTEDIAGNERIVSVGYKHFPRFVRKGDPILLGDGEIELEVVKVGTKEVVCKVAVGGQLSGRKGIHLPRSPVDLPVLTSRDRSALAFGIEQNVDFVALSFVRNSEDIFHARRELRKRGAEIPIVAKIERREAVDDIDAILEAVDGIIVARGDLGLEISLEEVPGVQKTIIRKANRAGKPVITATQVLRSMVESRHPTRAEVADIANAVLDGTDALMLSEETAVGHYSIEAVKCMATVTEEAEKILEPRPRFEGIKTSVPEAISHAAVSLARDLQVKAFLIPTTSGSTARMIARYRPRQPIIAISPAPRTVKALCLVWGVYPLQVRGFQGTGSMIDLALRKALKLGIVKRGDLVAITAGLPLHQPGTTNLITVKTVD